MKPAKFSYARPDSIDGVLVLLREHGDDAAVLSGGQTLVPMLNLRVATPQLLIDINAVAELDAISVDGATLSIGARARHNDVMRSDLVRGNAPLISEALHHVAHEAVRNRGTLGGSLALADPAAEMPACMVCLEAHIVLRSEDRERSVPASSFFLGIYDTDRKPDELITRIDIPIPDPSWRFAFHEFARRHGDFAMAGVTIGMRITDGIVDACRIVFMGIESFPRRIEKAETMFVGVAVTQREVIGQAAAALSDCLDCAESGEYPADYRLHLAQQLVIHSATKLFDEYGHG
jgi:carbon-monoxide dehydrogenase medium subunit